jgi:hypothetical protein
MITNIEELKSEILRRGIAKEEDLIGCEDRELESIEQQYGTLPLAYKQIMKLWGGGAEKVLSIYGDYFILARAISLNKWMEENTFLIDETKGTNINELKNVFFISGRYAEYGGGAEFIKIGENLVNTVVYNIDMALYDNLDEWVDSIEVAFDSIWAWIEIDLNEKESEMLKSKTLIPKLEVKDTKSFWKDFLTNNKYR